MTIRKFLLCCLFSEIYRNTQYPPPTLKPSHCLGSYIYLPYIPAFQGYTFLTYQPFRDIPSLHTCPLGIYLPYIPAFQGYTFITYLPLRDIPSLHTCLSGIYLPYIPACQGYTFLQVTWLPFRVIHSFKLHDCLSGIYLSYIPAFQGYTYLIYQPFRDIPFLYTSLSGIYLP